MNTVLQRDRKATQRERLLGAMVDVAAEDGYAAACIARVITRAGVSRPTFYDYFNDRDECFLAAIGEAHGRLLGRVRQLVAAQPPQDAATAAVQALVEFAETEPAMARLLFSEAMAAGHRALDARDATVAEIERIIEDALEQVPAATVLPDVPARIMLGASFRLLGCRLRCEQPQLAGLQAELREWLESYGRPMGEHRWRALAAAPLPAAWSTVPDSVLRSPAPPTGRRRGASEAQIVEERRRRVLFALAELASENGYGTVTITEIAERAGIDARAFYRIFEGKQQAFTALAELYFQQMMALTAGAFFTPGEWPQRVLAAKLALAACVEQNPALARACFIEGYAGERAAADRVEHLTRAFTMFLAEGHQYREHETPLPRVALEVIAHANFELVYHQARASAAPQMAGVLGHSIHLCLAPFIGPRAADELIDRELHPSRSAPAGANGSRAHEGHGHRRRPRAGKPSGEPR